MQIVQNQARQGDVLIMKAASLPKKVNRLEPESGREILAHGEATGHHHSFAMGDRIARFRDDGGAGGTYLTIGDGAAAPLEHQEHTAISFAPGKYRALRQRVFQAGMARRVAD